MVAGRESSSEPPLDYYAVLGVRREATADEIRLAYYERSLACHPDRVQGRQAEVDSLFWGRKIKSQKLNQFNSSPYYKLP
jgi:curved DNA-binding protein CbpA